MQLTNYAFMSSRLEYPDALRATSVAPTMLATPSRLDYSKEDTAAASQNRMLKPKINSSISQTHNLQYGYENFHHEQYNQSVRYSYTINNRVPSECHHERFRLLIILNLYLKTTHPYILHKLTHINSWRHPAVLASPNELGSCASRFM